MQTISLDDLTARLNRMSQSDLLRYEEKVDEWCAEKNVLRWQPNPGPQYAAYYCEADELLFGGEPGGGKSQLCLGLAFQAHKRSLVMRRKYGDLDRLIEDALEINGSRAGFNGSPPPKLRVSADQVIDFGAAQYVGDEQSWMGKGHDLLAIDEATHFAENQIRFLMGWVRSEDENQRTRVVLATNPPLRPEGLWVVKMFAPWLDPKFPRPAKAGELRWYYCDADGIDRWVDGPGSYELTDGRVMQSKSRTYIPSAIEDNPFYVRSNYRKQIDAMPEPYRSLLTGGFKTKFQDAPYQVIPTAWVHAAIDRWTPRPPEGIPMCAIGADASGGGVDPFVMAIRHGGWFAPFVEILAKDIPMDRAGHYCAGQIVSYRRNNAIVGIDLGGGYGSSTYERLKENEVEVVGFKGAEASTRRTKDGLLGFRNRRSEVYWRFREALDPSQTGGSQISLPDDPLLIADLTAQAQVAHEDKVITLEPKEDVSKRLGRSTDRGDACVIAWATGPNYVQGSIALERYNRYGEHGLARKRPDVLMGRMAYKRPGLRR